MPALRAQKPCDSPFLVCNGGVQRPRLYRASEFAAAECTSDQSHLLFRHRSI